MAGHALSGVLDRAGGRRTAADAGHGLLPADGHSVRLGVGPECCIARRAVCVAGAAWPGRFIRPANRAADQRRAYWHRLGGRDCAGRSNPDAGAGSATGVAGAAATTLSTATAELGDPASAVAGGGAFNPAPVAAQLWQRYGLVAVDLRWLGAVGWAGGLDPARWGQHAVRAAGRRGASARADSGGRSAL